MRWPVELVRRPLAVVLGSRPLALVVGIALHPPERS